MLDNPEASRMADELAIRQAVESGMFTEDEARLMSGEEDLEMFERTRITKNDLHCGTAFSAESEITGLTEKALDRVLEAGLRDDDTFRNWFISKTKFQGQDTRYLWSRSDNPCCSMRLSLPNTQTGRPEMVTRQGGTDVLFVFAFGTEPERRLALHIENKLASGRCTPFQPEVYDARARRWCRDPSNGNYEDWDTVVLAPLSFLRRYAETAQKFGTLVAHEDVAQYLPHLSADA
jgi:hypothetical protein